MSQINPFFLTPSLRWNYQTYCQNTNTKIKLSIMFPKHNHKNQILKNVSKTQSQRPNFQTFFENTNTKIKLSNLRRGMSQTQPGQQFLEEKFYIVSLCTIFVQLSPCAQPLHNKLLGKTISSLYFTSSSHLTQARPFAHRTEDSWTNGDPSTGTKL